MKPESIKPKPSTEIKVEEVLTRKPPSLHPEDSVEQAGERMREMKASEWPVAKEKELVGVVDQSDPDRAVARFGHDPKKTAVGQNMSRDVAFCYEDQTCAEALAVMDARGIHFLPVVDRQKRISGIVSREELVAAGRDGDREKAASER